MDFTGQVAIVTGASRGIGAALAEELGRKGAKVACVARGKGRSHITGRGSAEDVAERIRAAGGEAAAFNADMGKDSEVVAMVEDVIQRFGRIDILVNNAAMLMNETSLFSDLAAMDAEMAVNFRGPLLAIRTCAPYMREAAGGRILNVSSNLSLNVLPGMMIYGISKLALERLTLDAAAQLRPDSIACNAFRIDVPIHNSFVDELEFGQMMQPFTEPESTAVDGMVWMLEKPLGYTGQLESIWGLRQREGILPQRADQPFSWDVIPFDKASLRTSW